MVLADDVPFDLDQCTEPQGPAETVRSLTQPHTTALTSSAKSLMVFVLRRTNWQLRTLCRVGDRLEEQCVQADLTA